MLIGLPLLFLELGLGQLAQEGFTKTWRAVPLFRGMYQDEKFSVEILR